MTVRALVLTGFGINCERETAHAFACAGAAAECVHLNDLAAEPGRLAAAQIFAVPGGFSFGDDIASGRILANRLRYKLGGPLEDFVQGGGLVIGICNGFQVLVKMGLLPGGGGLEQSVTLAHNDSGRFDNRWTTLRAAPGTPCIWLRGMELFEAPIRHGEGKFIPRDQALLAELRASGQAALRYVQPGGAPANGAFPHNPNGSVDDIAGICDPTGRIFGLMPHPEAYIDGYQHPAWTRALPDAGAGLRIFQNAVDHARETAATAAAG